MGSDNPVVGGIPVNIPRIESEGDKAARHKVALANALEVVVQAMREAHRDGFEPQFGVGIDPYGRYSLQHPVSLVKRY
jgi:hypothetical protein